MHAFEQSARGCVHGGQHDRVVSVCTMFDLDRRSSGKGSGHTQLVVAERSRWIHRYCWTRNTITGNDDPVQRRRRFVENSVKPSNLPGWSSQGAIIVESMMLAILHDRCLLFLAIPLLAPNPLSQLGVPCAIDYGHTFKAANHRSQTIGLSV